MGDQYNKLDLDKQKIFVYGKFGKVNNSERNYFKVNGFWEKLDNNMEKMNLDLCFIVCYKFQMY